MKKYRVTLTQEERQHLEGIRKKGRVNAQKRTRAQIPLLADQGLPGPAWTDEKAA